MAQLQDLDDYKIETTFQKNPDCVIHTLYRANWARGTHKEAVTETWSSQDEIIGSGTFGTVHLQRRLDGKDDIRAVKQLWKSQMTRLNIDYRKELLALTKFSRSKFSHYQVFVTFLGWFENKNSVFLAMEYFPLGSLDKYIKEGMKENDARIISLQLLEGLRLMHEEGFTHRDLKPQNIFVVQKSPSWWVKIGDFGITKRVSNNDTALQTATGTPSYRAPEVLHYVEHEGAEEDESDEYTNAVDVWSFGCVIYEVMALEVPFPKYPQNIKKFCKDGSFPDGPLTQSTTKEGIEFIKSILVPLPSLRPSVNKVLEASWLQIEDLQASDFKHSIDKDKVINSQSGHHAMRVPRNSLVKQVRLLGNSLIEQARLLGNTLVKQVRLLGNGLIEVLDICLEKLREHAPPVHLLLLLFGVYLIIILAIIGFSTIYVNLSYYFS